MDNLCEAVDKVIHSLWITYIPYCGKNVKKNFFKIFVEKKCLTQASPAVTAAGGRSMLIYSGVYIVVVIVCSIYIIYYIYVYVYVYVCASCCCVDVMMHTVCVTVAQLRRLGQPAKLLCPHGIGHLS